MAITSPKKIEMIIETKEMKMVVVKPLNKTLNWLTPPYY